MDRAIYDAYVRILEEELVPAMGCTEPIAVAYAAALARQALGVRPEQARVRASANIIKNVKSVVVPNTGGLRGIGAAAAAGIAAGRPERKLEVLSGVTPAQIQEIAACLEELDCTVEQADNGHIFYIEVLLSGGGHTARAEITGHHTNVTRVERDGRALGHGKRKSDASPQEQPEGGETDRSVLTVEGIVEFADCVNPADVQAVLQRQIDCNTAIAQEGLRGDYGANIGSILLSAYGDGVHNRAKAWAAAGSDGRMNGCELPVVINSGSGNQGLAVSLPVIEYAGERSLPEEELLRALAVSNLISIYAKKKIGRLSAFCGASTAAAAAGAGIARLKGWDERRVAQVVESTLVNVGGLICDGAKSTCAAKLATALDAMLIAVDMLENGNSFGRAGLMGRDAEETLANVCFVGKNGMAETDVNVLRIMTGEIVTSRCRGGTCGQR